MSECVAFAGDFVCYECMKALGSPPEDPPISDFIYCTNCEKIKEKVYAHSDLCQECEQMETVRCKLCMVVLDYDDTEDRLCSSCKEEHDLSFEKACTDCGTFISEEESTKLGRVCLRCSRVSQFIQCGTCKKMYYSYVLGARGCKECGLGVDKQQCSFCLLEKEEAEMLNYDDLKACKKCIWE